MPDYRVLIADTRTGDILDDLPFAGFSLNTTVDWGRHDSMTINVPLTGTDPRRARVIGVAAEPWKRTLCLVRDGVAVWAGPLMTTGWSNSQVTFGCGGLTQLLDARMIFLNPSDQATFSVATGAGFTTPEMMSYLLQTAIDDAGTEPAYALPLALGGYPPGGEIIERTYYGRDLPTVYESVKKLTEEDGAPDVRFQAMLDANQSQLTWQALYGDPHLGVVEPVAAWEFPATIQALSGDLDGTNLMTRGYVLGDGQEDERLIGVATNGLAADGFPILERTDRSAVSTREPAAIEALANSLVSVNGRQAEAWSLDVDPQFPGLSGWSLGDNALFRVQDHWFLPNGEYVRRITGFALTADSLSLETTNPL